MFVLTSSVTDTGMGMAPEALSRLFKSFSQGDESIARRFGGTGLGLFISKQLCEKMGGNITVSSEVGEGSVFSFKIKLQKPAPSSPKPTLSTKEMPVMLPPLRILIAEDNSVNQKILKRHLKSLGSSDVTIVSDGLQAVEACQQAYDMVLMDIEMPNMDGIEAMQEIRKLPGKETLPIIAVTAHALTSECETFLNAGMNGYLSKPYNQEELRATILRCLPKATTSSSSSTSS
jgi:CheY-like chemotaxis protein